MKKSGLIFFILTFIVVGIIAIGFTMYAKGYRIRTNKIQSNGFLVMKSHPDSAEIYIDEKLKTVTNANVPLPPGTYNVSVRKDGYLDWNKRITIEKESVTEITAHLFRSVPSLSAITFSGVQDPIPSPDMTKIAYIVPFVSANPEQDKSGLWVMETVNLPLGFSREPRQVTNGDLTDSSFQWSPDGKEILLNTNSGTFLLDSGEFTPQTQRVNIRAQVDSILTEWQEIKTDKRNDKMRKLPDELGLLLQRKTKTMMFSPDEEMVLYVASGSAELKERYKKELPGSSTQKEQRDLKDNHTYVYDIEEDKNFLIDEGDGKLTIEGGFSDNFERRLSWFATSRHLILAENNKITIMDYDGTNRKEVYEGSYVSPHAFPTVSVDRLIILTNLGADSVQTNLYTLGLK